MFFINCENLYTITRDCGNNSGGIVRAWVADSNDTSWTADTTGQTVTALTSTTDFVLFEFNKNTSSFVSSEKIDLIATSTYFEVTTNFVFNRLSASKSRAVEVLGAGQRYLDLIILDANDTYWYIEEAQLITNEETTGVARADGSKYTISLKSDLNHSPYVISQALVLAVT